LPRDGRRHRGDPPDDAAEAITTDHREESPIGEVSVKIKKSACRFICLRRD
jgi:hypothetical protein